MVTAPFEATDVLRYLWPDNPISKVVVIVLAVTFVAWFSALAAYSYRLRKRLTAVSRLDADRVSRLIADRRDRIVNPSDDDGRNSGSPEPRESQRAHPVASASRNATSDAELSDATRALRLSSSDPVLRHVRTIIDAGCSERRVDPQDLLRVTTLALSRPASSFRAVLSLFIVVGLFGTLLGLADTLAQLSPSVSASTLKLSPEVMSGSLALLLGHLKGAFAPSIVGVFFTIVGGFCATVVQHFALSPLLDRVEFETVSTWVPRFLATDAERMRTSLERGERQLRRNFEAAEKVAQFAETIQSEAGEFAPKLRRANAALERVSKASDNLSEFSIRFVEAADRLVSFDTEIRTLYEQMLSNSSVFQESVRASTEVSNESHAKLLDIVKEQGTRLSHLTTTLKNYESSYLEDRKRIDDGLVQVLEASRSLFEDIRDRNREVIQGVAEPLTSLLSTKLANIAGALDTNLGNVGRHLAALDPPMKSAAEDFRRTISTLDTRTEKLAGELQREFLEQNKLDREQLERIGALAAALGTLIEQVTHLADSPPIPASPSGAKASDVATATVAAAFAPMLDELQELRRQWVKSSQNATERLEGAAQSVASAAEKLETLCQRVIQQPTSPRPSSSGDIPTNLHRGEKITGNDEGESALALPKLPERTTPPLPRSADPFPTQPKPLEGNSHEGRRWFQRLAFWRRR